MNNRENLLEAALNLFSVRGFQAVSVRELCGSLGLKESALYYHFRCKEDLLRELYDRTDCLIADMKTGFRTAFSGVTEVGQAEMCRVAVGFLRNYYCDSTVSRLLSMLSVERLRDPKAAEQYDRLAFSLPIEHCTEVFSEMIRRGIVMEGDPRTMARIYCSVIVAAWIRCGTGAGKCPERQARAEAEVSSAIGLFYDGIRRKKDEAFDRV